MTVVDALAPTAADIHSRATATPEPAAPISTVYRPAEPVDLRRTLSPLSRGAGDPTLRWEGSSVWRTARTPQGAATLRMTAGDGIHCAAWGPGAEWAIATVPELLGAGDDWSDLDLSAQPLLAEVWRRMPGLRLTRTGLVLEALIPAVLEQKVTTLEATRGWRRLVLQHGSPAPGPAPAGMRVVPDAETWRRIPSWEWHRAGVGPQRSQTAVRCARVGDSLERVARGGAAEAAAALTTVPGVGVWTAAETTQRSHGDPDAVSVGDYHLHDVVGWVLIGEKVDDERMLELLEPWRGQRQRVVRLIWASGLRAERRGPRATIRDNRGR